MPRLLRVLVNDVLLFVQLCETFYFCYCVCLCTSFCFYLKLFKHPLEKEGQVGGPILAQEEIKTIFGSIPDIYAVHTRIKVVYPNDQIIVLLSFWPCIVDVICYVWWFVHQSDLEELLTHWLEDRSVGDIILKYVSSNIC